MADQDTPEVYTLEAHDLEKVAKTLRKLNTVQEDVMLDIPDRILVRSFDDWEPIGYVVNIDDGWFFESITVDKRKEIGELGKQ